MPSILERKPPLVQFDFMEYGVDQDASKRAGRPIPRVVPFIFITPAGSKDRFEQPAEEWLAKKRNEAIEGKENPDWVTRWEMAYEMWKKGQELPPEGQPIRTWAALNREQNTRLIALGYLTIEQLAECPDNGLALIGLDGRYLRDLAKKTLEQNANGGAQAIEIAELKQSLRDKDQTIAGMMERLTALEQANPEKRGPGRPKGS